MKTATTYSPLQRLICTICILLMVSEVVAPLAYIGIYNRAEASGATQSDLVIAATGGDLVDPFTGNFNYSIPLGTVAGTHGLDFPITLSYTSGQTVESDASFVGWGWSTGFGAINRFVNGYPDDAYGFPVKKYAKNAPQIQWSLSLTPPNSVEIFDTEFGGAQASGGIGFQFSSRNGFSISYSLGISFPYADVSANHNDGRTGFSARQKFIAPFLRDVAGKYLFSRRQMNFLDRIPVVNRMISGDIYPGLNSLNSLAISSSTTKSSTYTLRGNLPAQTGSVILGSYLFSVDCMYSETTTDSRDVKGYGLMYLAEGMEQKHGSEKYEVELDYGIESDRQYYKDISQTMGMPLLSQDSWTVSGTGPTGAFEVLREDVGTVEPLSTINTSISGRIEPEVRGPNGVELFSAGFSGAVSPVFSGPSYAYQGFGKNNEFNKGSYKSRFAKNNSLNEGRSDGKQNPVKFVYVGDKGYSSNVVLPAGNRHDEVPDNYFGRVEDHSLVGMRHGRLSHTPTKSIEYRTFEDLFVSVGNFEVFSGRMLMTNMTTYEYFELLTKKTYLENIYGPLDKSWKKMIAQMMITDETGTRYVYSIPVFSMREQNVSVGNSYNDDGSINETFNLGYLYGNRYYGAVSGFSNTGSGEVNDVIPNNRIVQGKWSEKPYVSSFLLTQILSPEYTDQHQTPNSLGAGPTSDDIGGYILFQYQKKNGINVGVNPITWNTPYIGGYYSSGMLSDPYDDRVSFQRGMREEYYPFKVQTRTHSAYYILNTTYRNWADANTIYQGTGINRKDGLYHKNAPLNTSYSTSLLNSNNSGIVSGVDASSTNRPSYLEKIIICSKQSEERELTEKTIHFAYDYSLAKGQYSSEMNGSSRAGKLTLKNIWVQDAGVEDAIQYPYTFEYERRTTAPSGLDPVQQAFFASSATGPVNPDYSPINIDPWGYYDSRALPFLPNKTSSVAESNLDLMELNVKSQNPLTLDDPGIWNLRKISLPTGGEIYVDYEAKSYTHVQDKEAEVLVKLHPTSIDDPGDYGENTPTNKYVLDLVPTFGSLPSSSIDKIVEKIRAKYIDGGDYIYFRFKYDFVADNVTKALKQGHSPTKKEVIEGFAKVYSVVRNADKIEIVLGPQKRIRRKTSREETIGKIGSGSQPISLAQSLVDNQPSLIRNISALGSGNILTIIGSYVQAATDIISGGLLTSTKNYAPDLVENHSFIRIPVHKEKIGGGPRVSKVITYTPSSSLENGDAAAYGLRYQYAEVGQDYGVATNEPSGFYYDNALHRVWNPDDPSLAGKAIGGENLSQFSYYMGESLLPPPGVFHSKTISHNINTTWSAPGHTVYHYNTVKEYPSVTVKAGASTRNSRGTNNLWKTLTNIAKISQDNYESVAFILNSLHGTLRSKHVYPGVYDPNASDGPTPPSYAETYVYHDMFQDVPLFYGMDRPLRNGVIGTTHKVCLEDKWAQQNWDELNLQWSVTFLIPYPPVPPLPIFSLSGNYACDYSELRQVLISHVVYQPPIIKSVKTLQDGVEKLVENKVFDAYTGEPVVTTYRDVYDGVSMTGGEIDGTYWDVTVPAHHYYPSMRAKSELPRKVFTTKENTPENHWYPYSVSYAKHGTDQYKINFSSYPLSDAASNKEREIVQQEIKNTFNKGDQLLISYQKSNTSHFITGFVSDIQTDNINDIGITLKNLSYSESTLPASIGISERRSFSVVQSVRQNALGLASDKWLLYGMEEWFESRAIYAKSLYNKDRFGRAVQNMIDQRYGNYPFSGVDQGTPANKYYGTYDPEGFLAYKSASGSDIFDVAYRAWHFKESSTQYGKWSSYTDPDKKINPFIRYYVEHVPGSLGVPGDRDVYFGFADSKSSSLTWPSDISGNYYANTVANWSKKVFYGGWYHRKFGASDQGRLMAHSSFNYPTITAYQPELDFRSNLVNALPVSDVINGGTSGYLCSPTANPSSTGWSPLSNDYVFFDEEEWNVITASSLRYRLYQTTDIGGLPVAAYTSNNVRSVWRPWVEYLLRSYDNSTPTTGASPAQRGYGTVSDYIRINPANIEANSSNMAIAPPLTSGWIVNSHMIAYNPQGLPALMKNRLQTPTATLYHSKFQVPLIEAFNAAPENLAFNSCEPSSYYNLPAGQRHSGYGSISIAGAGSVSLNVPFVSPDLVAPSTSNKMLLKLWIYGLPVNSSGKGNPQSISLSNLPVGVSVVKECLATVNGWSLIEFTLNITSGMLSINPSLAYSGTTQIYVDDIVVFPFDAEVKCNVIHSDRGYPLVVFDTQHFGVFTQYDVRNVPVRTYRETERGLLLLSEKLANMPGMLRSSLVPISSVMSGSSSPTLHSGYDTHVVTPMDQLVPVIKNNSIGRRPISAEPPNMPRLPQLGLPNAAASGEIIKTQLTPESRELKIFGADVLDADSIRSMPTNKKTDSLDVKKQGSGSIRKKNSDPNDGGKK